MNNNNYMNIQWYCIMPQCELQCMRKDHNIILFLAICYSLGIAFIFYWIKSAIHLKQKL